MPDQRIDQIEFRWQRQNDLSAIASSNPGIAGRWDQMLAKYVGIPRMLAGDPLPTHSAVYFVSQKNEAAVILRSSMPGAIRAAEGAGEERHRLVARALVGTANVLTADLALCLACMEGYEVLGAAPGQVRPNGVLSALEPGVLRAETVSVRSELSQKARNDPRLAKLIAHRINNPTLAMSVVLTADEAARSIFMSPAAPLLWGLAHTIDPLLEGAEGVHPWFRTFSTFESPPRDADGRTMPQIVFEAPTQNRLRPNDRQRVVLETDRIPGDNETATLLARAYEDLGDGLTPYLERARKAGPALSLRLEALRRDKDLMYWQSARTQPSKTANLARAAATAPARPEPDLSRATQNTWPTPNNESRPSWRADAVSGMYDQLSGVKNDIRFAEVAELIAARAALTAEVPVNEAARVIRCIEENDWYLEQLTNLYGRAKATKKLSLLLEPVLRGLVRDQPALDLVAAGWDVAPLQVRLAMARARARIDGEQGVILEKLLLRLLDRQAQPSDTILDGERIESTPSVWVFRLPVGKLNAKWVAVIAWYAIAMTVLAVCLWFLFS